MDAAQFNQFLDKLNTAFTKNSGAAKPKERDPEKLSELDALKWTTFRDHFEQVSTLNNWDATRGVAILKTCMTDAAARATAHLDLTGKTVKEALAEMEKIFVNPAATDLYEVQFDLADKEPGENLLALHTRYCEMFLRAFPTLKTTAESSKKLKDKFALKLGDKGISYGLTSSTDYKTLTYTELLTRAQELQASALRCRQSYQPSKPTVMAMATKPNVEDRRCFFCNNKGHVVKDCRKKKAAMAEGLDNSPQGGPPDQYQAAASRGRVGNTRGRGRGQRGNRASTRGRSISDHRFMNPGRKGINALDNVEDQHSSGEPLDSASEAVEDNFDHAFFPDALGN